MPTTTQQEISRSDEARYDHRLHGLLLVCNGHSTTQVAPRCSARSGARCRVGLTASRATEGLREGERTGRPSRMNAKQWARLGRDLRASPREFGFAQTMWDGALVREHLRQRYQVKLGVRQCQRLSGWMGFRWRKPGPLVGQADPAAQRACKKTASNRSHPGVELWSLDERHFQQHGMRTYMWVPPETRDPVLRHAPTRKSGACFGAVQCRRGKLVTVMNPKFDAITFETFLRQLLRHRSPGRRMVILPDNAKYHHASLLKTLLRKHRRRLKLLFLPPCKSAAQSHRASLEAQATAGDTQPILRNARRTVAGCHGALRSVGAAQSTVGKAMRHHSGRRVSQALEKVSPPVLTDGHVVIHTAD